MRKVRLVYTNTSNEKVDLTELKNIHETVRKNSNEINESGILIFSNIYFLQCLEGEKEIVNSVYEKITKNQRHKNWGTLRL